MAARWFDSPEDEDRVVRQVEMARQRRVQTAKTLTPDLGARTAAIRKMYPTLGSSAVVFAQAGLNPNSPEVKAAAEAKMKIAAKKDQGFQLGKVMKGIARTTTTVLAAPIEEFQGLVRNVSTFGDSGKALAGAGSGAAIGAGFGSIIPGAGTGAGAVVGGLIGGVAGLVAPDVEGEAKWESQSNAGVAIGQALDPDEKVDLGTGYFAGGSVRAEQIERSRNVKVGGRSLTPGRFLASAVVEPGTKPYNIASGLLDASVALGPADLGGDALKVAGQVNRGRKLFAPDPTALGIVSGARKTVVSERVSQWLDGKDGQKVIGRLAETDSFDAVWKLMGKKVDVGTAVRLADAKTPEEIRGILQPELGINIREKPTVPSAFKETVQRRAENVRLLNSMPGRFFDIDRPDQAVEQMDRFMANAKMDPETRAFYNEKMARANGRPEKFQVVIDAFGEVGTKLLDVAGDSKGANRGAIRSLTTAWKNQYDELTKFFTDEVGQNVPVMGAVIGGSDLPTASPHLYNEFINQLIPSPDARAIRRMTSKYGRVLNKPGLDIGVAALDFLSQDVWKPMVLLRGAWTVRVVGEEQVRMAATGLDSLVSHPLRAIAWATGRRGAEDVKGEMFDADDDLSDFARALTNRSNGHGGWRDKVKAKGKVNIDKARDPDAYVKGWAGELGQLANDPIAMRVAGGLKAGDGIPTRIAEEPIKTTRRLGSDPAEIDDVYVPPDIYRGAQTLPPTPEGHVRLYRTGADGDYFAEDIHGAFYFRSITRHGTEANTLRYIDVPIDEYQGYGPRFSSAEYGAGRDELREINEVKLPRDRAAQAKVVQPVKPSSVTPSGNPLDDVKEWFFNGTGSKFRAEMSEGRGGDVLATRTRADGGTYLTDGKILSADDYIESVFHRIQIKTGQDERLMRAVADGAINGKKFRDKDSAKELLTFLDEGIGPQTVKGDITLVGVDTAGSKVSAGLDKATDALFGVLMTKPTNKLSRSPAFKQFYWKQGIEELIPFMDEAGQKAAVEAARKAGLDDKTISRMQKRMGTGTGDLSLDVADLVAKSRALDSTKSLLYDLTDKNQASDIARIIFPFAEAWKEIMVTWAKLGTENPTSIRRVQQTIQGARGAGFFKKDEATGDEVFVYPGSEFITSKLLGVPTPLVGRVQGLNLFSSGAVLVPGFGPAVQMSVGKLIPHKPDYDWVREIVTPFGEVDTEGGYVESFLPGWYQKVRKAMADPESDRVFGNTVADVAKYLTSTGEYDLSTIDGQEKLSKDAITRARGMYVLRALGSAFAPTPPTPQFMARDKNGNLLTAHKLAQEFRDLSAANYETAVEEFLDKYGEDALLYMQPKSRGGFNPTEELHEWVRENEDLSRKFPDVYGYFAPAGGEFSIQELDRQLATGERENLTPEEGIRVANARVAAMKYRKAQESVGPNPTSVQRAWLRDIRETLVEEYPGYEPEKFELGKTEVAIRQLKNAVADPKIAKTDAGQGLALYMKAREQAVQAAQAQGLSGFGRAKAMAPVRDWLRDIADTITEEHPDFLPLYDRILEREMTDDDVDAA